MKVRKKIAYTIYGFIGAAMLLTMTQVFATVEKDLSRVIVANDLKNPVPVSIRKTVEVKGEVEIKGKPEVKIDEDGGLEIKSIKKPVRVEFEDGQTTANSAIFRKGKVYSILFLGENRRCKVDSINGIWIKCQNEFMENALNGWINTTHISRVTEE